MAAPDRQPPAAVSQFEALAKEPHRFDFARAMRLMECAFPKRPRLGRSVRPSDDPVRLGQQIRAIDAAAAGNDRRRVRAKLGAELGEFFVHAGLR